MEIRQDILLKDYAWWKIGGPADFFCLPKSVDDVHRAIQFASEKKLPITVLGGGTNVLISDLGVEGLVICTRELSGATVSEIEGRCQIEALAGTPKSALLKEFLKRRLAPALFLCGLPGDVGGGVVMNAGVAENVEPREFVEITDWFEVVDFKTNQLKRFQKNQIQWTYRHTQGWPAGIIVKAQISWPMQPDPQIPQKVKDATRLRLQRQPLELPSCGSTFKNPVGHKAGALIDKAGLKGLQVGGAQVSPKHANFIVNVGGATSQDVKAIMAKVQSEVKSQFGVDLETEVKFLGR